MYHIHDKHLRDTKLNNNIVGCLLGGALGDSMGACFENQPTSKFQVPSTLNVTDDTQLTIATCEAIIASGRVDAESIAARMTAWFRDQRITGIGASTLKSLTELDAGGHWAMVGATGEQSAGNGAAMRIAPLAFFLDPASSADRTTICDVCRITHRNDEAYLGALAILVSIKHGKLDRSLIIRLVDSLPDSRIRDRFVEIWNDNVSAKQLATRYRPTGYVVDSVPMSILVASESESMIESLESIIQFGGDTDTVASMFGQIYGAVNGPDELPMELVQRINEFELIQRTAIELAQTSGAN